MKISFWDILTGILMFAGFGVVLVFANIFIDPYTILNPFPPPTIQPTIKVPTNTPTLNSLPAIWTATPTGNFQTTTLMPSLTPVASKTSFTLVPTNTFSPIPSLTPVGTNTPQGARTNTPQGGRSSTPTRTRTATANSFAITSVQYVSASPSGYVGSCPKTFTMSADIYYNRDGEFTYYWVRKSDNAHLGGGSFDLDGSSPDDFSTTLTLGSGTGAQTDTYYLYINYPNHQQFGGVEIPITCTGLQITTNGSNGATASVSIAENTPTTTAIATVTTNIGGSTYSITGGADSSLITINPTSGVLTFNSIPDYEAPVDGGANHTYEIIVHAVNGSYTDDQTITITVTDVNDIAPGFTSGTAFSVAENTTTVTTVTASDGDSSPTLTFSLVAGGDASAFNITSGGVLTFVSAPNYENPTDVGTNHVYDITVQVTDGVHPVTQAITVTVTDKPPVFTSSTTFSVEENATGIGTVTASDGDASTTMNYTITGGDDAGMFGITAGGVLTFNSAHDHENPTDTGTDNVYDVTVQVTDGANPVTQNIAVTVTNLDEAPTVGKSFSVEPISAAGTATLTITIANTSSNAVALTNVAFTDAFPAGMAVAATPAESTSGCGSPTFTPSASDTTLNFSGGSIAVGATCTVTVNVTATTAGTNTTSVVSSTEADDGAAASAIFTVGS